MKLQVPTILEKSMVSQARSWDSLIMILIESTFRAFNYFVSFHLKYIY